MGLAPEMKLVIKRTFLEYEFVEENERDGCPRPRSFTDPAGHFTNWSCEKHSEVASEADTTDSTDATSDRASSEANTGPEVNESATEELKAFLGLGLAQEELPSSPPVKLPDLKQTASPPSRSNRSSPMQETYDWQPEQAMDPLTLPQCYMTTWWMPSVVADTKPVLQISDMIPATMEEGYMSQQWPQQQQPQNYGYTSYVSDCSQHVSTSSAEAPEAQRTTVILRNLPNNYTRGMLLHLLDSEGFARKYDFVYIPVDFSTQAGLGYAFVNLISPSDAIAFWEHFEGFKQWSLPSEKVCALNWSSPIQGLAAHMERYRNSPVMHEAVPDEWKPAIYYNGERLVFPAPTKNLKAPKMRTNKSY